MVLMSYPSSRRWVPNEWRNVWQLAGPPDLDFAHLRRVPVVRQEGEPPDPVDVRLLSPVAVMPDANRLADLRLSCKEREQVRDSLVSSWHGPISALGMPPASLHALDRRDPVLVIGEDDFESACFCRGARGRRTLTGVLPALILMGDGCDSVSGVDTTSNENGDASQDPHLVRSAIRTRRRPSSAPRRARRIVFPLDRSLRDGRPLCFAQARLALSQATGTPPATARTLDVAFSLRPAGRSIDRPGRP